MTIAMSTKLQGVVMTTEGHVAALERRHQELDRQIQAEMQSTRYDELAISALKRKKLEVKDELYKYTVGSQ
ncbi:YdcH family protein [Devosia yakushimensis]|nr:YdcH family protein [Devosia yakushimensis]